MYGFRNAADSMDMLVDCLALSGNGNLMNSTTNS